MREPQERAIVHARAVEHGVSRIVKVQNLVLDDRTARQGLALSAPDSPAPATEGQRVIDEAEWTEKARCRGLDPDQFFVRGAAQSRRAIKVCARCTVKDDCLTYALDNAIDFGVWGGLTERQRRAVRRRQVA